MKIIPLTQGKVALVDDEDFSVVSKFKWCAIEGKTGVWYAVRRAEGKTLYLHKVLVPGIPRVDHRDGNGLNNQRNNLRSASSVENGQNSRKYRNNTSGFKGVSWHKRQGRWQVRIRVRKVLKFLGFVESAREGGELYRKAAQKYFGEFAR